MLILISVMLVFVSLAFKSAVSTIHYAPAPSGIQLPEVRIYGSKVALNAPGTARFINTGWQPTGC